MKIMTTCTIALALTGAAGYGQLTRSAAQKIVDEVKAAHPEITGLELAAEETGKGCRTIAATDVKEIGQKCDKDELTARKTNRPFVEKEKTEFDVTVPLHDGGGQVVATAGMDFKIEPGRTTQSVTSDALKIAAEIERRLR